MGSELAETRAAMGGLKTEMQKALVCELSSARRQIDRLEREPDRPQKNHRGLLAATKRIQQEYRSDTYVDRAIKTLGLSWENNGWKIRKETSRTVK